MRQFKICSVFLITIIIKISDHYHDGTSFRDPAIRCIGLIFRLPARMASFKGPPDRFGSFWPADMETFNTPIDWKQEIDLSPNELCVRDFISRNQIFKLIYLEQTLFSLTGCDIYDNGPLFCTWILSTVEDSSERPIKSRVGLHVATKLIALHVNGCICWGLESEWNRKHSLNMSNPWIKSGYVKTAWGLRHLAWIWILSFFDVIGTLNRWRSSWNDLSTQ